MILLWGSCGVHTFQKFGFTKQIKTKNKLNQIRNVTHSKIMGHTISISNLAKKA